MHASLMPPRNTPRSRQPRVAFALIPPENWELSSKEERCVPFPHQPEELPSCTNGSPAAASPDLLEYGAYLGGIPRAGFSHSLLLGLCQRWEEFEQGVMGGGSGWAERQHCLWCLCSLPSKPNALPIAITLGMNGYLLTGATMGHRERMRPKEISSPYP